MLGPETLHSKIDAILLKKGVFPVHLSARLERFRNVPAEPPAFITGPVGSGKTFLAVAYLAKAVAIALDLPNEQSAADRAVARIKFLRAVDLTMALRSSFKDFSTARIIDYLSKAAFLALDDLGTERDSPLVQESLYSVFDYRLGHGLRTIITSNFSLGQIAGLYGDYGDRLASRIAGLGPALTLKGKDRRL